MQGLDFVNQTRWKHLEQKMEVNFDNILNDVLDVVLVGWGYCKIKGGANWTTRKGATCLFFTLVLLNFHRPVKLLKSFGIDTFIK